MAQPYGLQNVGNTCYLNSMLQCLLSCDSFNKFVFTMKPNEFAEEYKKLYMHGGDAAGVLRFIIKGVDSPANLHFGTQEDSNEGFMLLMDVISKYGNINQVFNIRYVSEYHCSLCELHQINKDDECEIFISYEDGSIEFEQYIRLQANRIIDYKCPRCGKTGGTIQTKKLCRIPDVVVVLMKKYNHKSLLQLPLSFSIQTLTKPNIYKLVGTIEHYGSQTGGHYVAQCRRNNNEYLFNDASVTPHPLSVTSNTYVAFYQVEK